MPAILTHGEHGLLAGLADYETLGHHVLRLLDNPAYARALARAAYNTTEACTWPAVRDQWLRAYRRAMWPHAAAETDGSRAQIEPENFPRGSPVSSAAESSR